MHTKKVIWGNYKWRTQLQKIKVNCGWWWDSSRKISENKNQVGYIEIPFHFSLWSVFLQWHNRHVFHNEKINSKCGIFGFIYYSALLSFLYWLSYIHHVAKIKHRNTRGLCEGSFYPPYLGCQNKTVHHKMTWQYLWSICGPHGHVVCVQSSIAMFSIWY